MGFTSHPLHTLRLWRDSGALHLFMPELVGMEGEDHQEVYQKTTTLLNALFSNVLKEQYHTPEPPLSVQVSALLLYPSMEEPQHAYNVCIKLHFHQFGKKHWSYVDCNEVLWLVEHARILKTTDPASMRPSYFEKIFGGERGASLLELIHAIQIAEGKHSVERDRLHIARRMRTHLLEHAESPRLSGRDLTAMGIEPGPHFRELLAIARDLELSSPGISTEELQHQILKAHHAGI